MTEWNFADIWEVVADSLADAPALVQGTRRQTWREVDARADGLAKALVDLGLSHQDKVAHYLFNCPEYLESTFALFKAALVPVNTNYRYTNDELGHIWEDSDAAAVIFHGSFSERVEALRARVRAVRAWIWVDDGSGPCPDWAVAYEELVKTPSPRFRPTWGRSPDDLLLLYTGGTTGMPKGVMWRQDDLFASLNSASPISYPEGTGLAGLRESLIDPGPVILPSCPLMHGTGLFTSLIVMSLGGSIVTLANRKFDPVELLDTIERDRVNVLVIVGDAFGRPVLEALDAEPDRWDLSALLMIVSSGVIWSEPVKAGFLRRIPSLILADLFASSEAVGMGSSIASSSTTSSTGEFTLGKHARVITAEGRDIEPGSGEVGVLALEGRGPIGYYKDPEKSAGTFKVIDGKRYSIPGDYAMVEKDCTVKLLGRGSVCINTGGEKVYPEEVEEVIKVFPGVRDAAVVGLADERFGEVICAVVETEPGVAVLQSELAAHVKSKLAGFKAPRRMVTVGSLERSPSGKIDYARLKALCAASFAPGDSPMPVP